MRKKILIFGNYGVPNWGDEAIVAGILSQIDFRKYSVSVITHQKKWTEYQYKKSNIVKGISPPPFGIRSFANGLFGGIFETKKAIQESDYILFGGGGLFQDRPKKAIQLWNFYLQICQYYRKKICIVGNSFEALEQKKNATKSQKLFTKIPFFSVRDEHSQKILQKEFSVPHLKTSNSTDAAYFLPRNSKTGRKKGILLAFREGEEGFSEKKEKKLLKILQEVFPHYFEKNEIEVLVMQEKNSGDKNFALRHNLPYFEATNLDEVQEKIRSSKLVISSRLHASILANISGTPFLALAPRQKIQHFFGEEFSTPLKNIFTKKGEKIFQEKLRNFSTLKVPQKKFYDAQVKKLPYFFPDFLRS